MTTSTFCADQVREHLADFKYDPLDLSTTAPLDPVLRPLETLVTLRSLAVRSIEERLAIQVGWLERDARYARDALRRGHTPDVTDAALRVRELSAAQHEARAAFTQIIQTIEVILRDRSARAQEADQR